ncbi:MAG: AAA family ATPase [Chloroflexota bacterium]
MRCAACGTENRPDRKFCAQCGAALARPCPTCGAANLPGERFCGECGRALEDGAASVDSLPTAAGTSTGSSAGPTATAGGAERRLVSVLFVDLVGSTAIAEAKDPESVRELLGDWFETARAVIDRYGGTVEKFIGDAVMAVWGAPAAHEDDAERAVRAALDLVDAVGSLGERAGVGDLAARGAVLTGEAAVTLGAQGQGLVAGDLVNTASRLQGVAAPGTVLVNEGTEQATRDAIAFESAGEYDMKGKAMPVAAWRAVRVVAGRKGAGRADRLEAPFVGRAAELRALKDALAATGAEHRARYVAITGQAGVGKSRLAWELEKYLDGLVESIYWHRGRSPSYGEGIAYWALGEMVRSRAGILETDSPAVSTAKLSTALETYVADPEDRRWIEPHLRVLLGLDTASGGDRNEQFGAWRRFFENVATLGTVGLVFEDLQWADDGLLDFIDSVLEWSRNQPILVITLARPELTERRPTLGTAGRNAITLHLDPLDADEMRELLAGLAPELEQDVVDAVVSRSDGIPLYAIELVRMVRDAGAGRAGETGKLSIPPSLRALVAARLDALSAADRSLLQDAAVLGQSFTIPGLAVVSGEDPATLESRLRTLVRREFLSVEADPRSPERGQYAFVQSVVHEVAYGTLARRDRRTRHLSAARYIDSLGDESMATVVATHYLEAYRAAPDDEQGRVIRAQARVALRAAAERSARLHNYGQAVRDLERSLELTDDAADRAGLLVQQAELNEADARYDEAIETATLARAAYDALADTTATLQTTALLGRIEMKRGHWDEAAVLLERGLATLDPSSDPATYARLAAEFSRTHMVNNRDADGVLWADRALAAAGPLRRVDIIAEAMNTKGVCLQYIGRLDEGIALIRASVDLAAVHHLSGAELRARFNLAGRLTTEDPNEGIEVLRSGVEVARRYGRRDWLMRLSHQLSRALVSFGLDHDEALALLDDLDEREAPPEEQAESIVDRARVMAYRGDRTAWPRGMAEARALTAGMSSPQREWDWATSATDVAIAEGRLADAARESTAIGGNWVGMATLARARIALRSGDADGARTAIGSSDQILEIGGLFDVHRLGFGAGIAALEGHRDEAVAGYLESVRRARQIGMLLPAADLLLDAVYVLGPDDPATPAFADEARALYTAARARAQLDRLDEALARAPATAAEGTATRTDRGTMIGGTRRASSGP